MSDVVPNSNVAKSVAIYMTVRILTCCLRSWPWWGRISTLTALLSPMLLSETVGYTVCYETWEMVSCFLTIMAVTQKPSLSNTRQSVRKLAFVGPHIPSACRRFSHRCVSCSLQHDRWRLSQPIPVISHLQVSLLWHASPPSFPSRGSRIPILLSQDWAVVLAWEKCQPLLPTPAWKGLVFHPLAPFIWSWGDNSSKMCSPFSPLRKGKCSLVLSRTGSRHSILTQHHSRRSAQIINLNIY